MAQSGKSADKPDASAREEAQTKSGQAPKPSGDSPKPHGDPMRHVIEDKG